MLFYLMGDMLVMKINKLIRVEFFALEYNDKKWDDFSKCFNNTNVFLKGIPKDIINVLVQILGIEESKIWINKPLTALDGKRAIDLVKSTIVCNALKAFIMRIPI